MAVKKVCVHYGCGKPLTPNQPKTGLKFCTEHDTELDEILITKDYTKELLAFWVRCYGGAEQMAEELVPGVPDIVDVLKDIGGEQGYPPHYEAARRSRALVQCETGVIMEYPQDTDVTKLVDIGFNDDESAPIMKCVCGTEFLRWTQILSIYRDNNAWRCPNCERRLYFQIGLRVYQITPHGA